MTELINVEYDDIRVGDTGTLAREGHEFTGPVWEDLTGDLYVGVSRVSDHDGRYPHLTFVSATRPKPETCWNGDEIVDGKAYLAQYRSAAYLLRRDGKWCWPDDGGAVKNPAAVKPLCALPLTLEQLTEALA